MAAVGARPVPWDPLDHRGGPVCPPLERVGSPLSRLIAVMVWAIPSATVDALGAYPVTWNQVATVGLDGSLRRKWPRGHCWAVRPW